MSEPLKTTCLDCGAKSVHDSGYVPPCFNCGAKNIVVNIPGAPSAVPLMVIIAFVFLALGFAIA